MQDTLVWSVDKITLSLHYIIRIMWQFYYAFRKYNEIYVYL